MKNILLLLLPILSACVADPPKSEISSSIPVSNIQSDSTEIQDLKKKIAQVQQETANVRKKIHKETSLKQKLEATQKKRNQKEWKRLQKVMESVIKEKTLVDDELEEVRTARILLQKGTPQVQKSIATKHTFRDRLKDGSKGPQMVWIKGGSFEMGSNNGRSNEKPVHTVKIDGFAMGKYEVTFAEYDKFANAKGKSKPSDSGWG